MNGKELWWKIRRFLKKMEEAAPKAASIGRCGHGRCQVAAGGRVYLGRLRLAKTLSYYFLVFYLGIRSTSEMCGKKTPGRLSLETLSGFDSKAVPSLHLCMYT